MIRGFTRFVAAVAMASVLAGCGVSQREMEPILAKERTSWEQALTEREERIRAQEALKRNAVELESMRREMTIAAEREKADAARRAEAQERQRVEQAQKVAQVEAERLAKEVARKAEEAQKARLAAQQEVEQAWLAAQRESEQIEREKEAQQREKDEALKRQPSACGS